MTKTELLKKLKLLQPKTLSQRNTLTCALIGHSRIQTVFFGYYSCARCGDQLGDTLGSVYSEASNAVIVGHNCKTCRKNYKQLMWKDKLYAPNPFEKEK